MSKVTERLTIGKEQDSSIQDQHVSRYEFAREYVQNKRVLDVACGTGYGTEMLKKYGASGVVGIDLSEEAIAAAMRFHANDGVEYIIGSATNLAHIGKFDIVVSFETIEHLTEFEGFLEQVASVVSVPGLVLISTPVREKGSISDKPKNPFHIQEWSVEEFQNLLSKYFTSVSISGQYNFPKKWYPYSRTIRWKLFKKLFPNDFEILKKYPVLSNEPKYEHFQLTMSYIVAICKVGYIND